MSKDLFQNKYRVKSARYYNWDYSTPWWYYVTICTKNKIPYFGKAYLFSMTCSNCRYHKADIESAEKRDPVKFSFEVSSEEDMKVRVVKSSQAIIKIPHMTTIEAGPASIGFVTNIEGILNRVKRILEATRESEDDNKNT